MKKAIIDGIKYQIDFENGVLKPFHRLGQKYKHRSGSIYILVCVEVFGSGHFLSFNNIETGCPYGSCKIIKYKGPTTVISDDLFCSVVEGNSQYFTAIE